MRGSTLLDPLLVLSFQTTTLLPLRPSPQEYHGVSRTQAQAEIHHPSNYTCSLGSLLSSLRSAHS